MLSASVVCCTYLITFFAYVSIEANSVNPGQTALTEAARYEYTLFVEDTNIIADD